MRALSSSDFLDLWERGFHLHPLDQGLLVLGAAVPGESYESLADWPFGRRNRALAQLGLGCFGPNPGAWTSCTRCGEKLEVEVDFRNLVNGAMENGSRHGEPIVVKGRSFRLPTSRDLALAAEETDVRSAAVRLVTTCAVEAGNTPLWSDEDLEEVGEGMALADPMAEITFHFSCPACGNEGNAALDIASFIWEEIAARARRLIFEIHCLASAYGWTEGEILALSEHRRALYLEMVQA
jgi:hypothetical protein